jgi:DNA-binding response OmpR family regulator
MGRQRILIVDDQAEIREIVRGYVLNDGFDADEAEDGAKALELIRSNAYSVVVLDVMMPRIDGWTVCREIRRTSRVPICMLSARGEEYDKILAFELGVDDYVVKPFSPRELLARIRVLARRSAADAPKVDPADRLEFPGVVIDVAGRTIGVDGHGVPITSREFDLLQHLASHPGRVFTRDQLLESVWGYEFTGDGRTVDTHVKTVREHLGPYRRYLATVWGVGYKFDAEAVL